MGGRMAPLDRASQFFGRRVWSEDLRELPSFKAWCYGAARVLYLAAQGFVRDQGLHRASALSFDTVLGLVPLLAFLVSILKGFGVYDELMRDTLKPWIWDVTANMHAPPSENLSSLRTAFLKLVEFVERADFGHIGLVGLGLLLYITVLLLYSVESSMNHIFAAESERNLARKISDYAAILFITPLCAMIAAGIAARARQLPWIGQLGAVATMSFGLTMVYVVMPFTRVRVRSAFFGGCVAGVLWYLLLALHVYFQIGVARYNAIYSTFAAFPIFLVWVFSSWLIVIFGAELAAAHQNTAAFRYRVLGTRTEHAAKKYLALRSITEIGRAFVRGEPPPKLSDLSATIRVPERLLREVLDRMSEAGLLARAVRGSASAYVPGRDIDSITVGSVLTALEEEADHDKHPPEDAADALIVRVLHGLDTVVESSQHNHTLRELVLLSEGVGQRLSESVAPESYRAAGAGRG